MIIPDPIFDVKITLHNVRDYAVWAYEADVTVNGTPVFTRFYSDEYETEGITELMIHSDLTVTTTGFADSDSEARDLVLDEFADRLKDRLA